MVHADLICVPQLMSGEQALAAQIGGNRTSRGKADTVGVVTRVAAGRLQLQPGRDDFAHHQEGQPFEADQWHLLSHLIEGSVADGEHRDPMRDRSECSAGPRTGERRLTQGRPRRVLPSPADDVCAGQASARPRSPEP